MFPKILSICLFLRVAECIGHCQKINVSPDLWKNEGVAVIYVMKSSHQNWQTHVSTLVNLQNSLKNIDVNVNLVIAINKNCSAYENSQGFKIEGGEIWKTLDHHNDYPEAYVVDRCGKVTYHITFPWSLVKWFPFVKGAILSTFFDKPCGPCDLFHSYYVEPPKELAQIENIKVYPKETHSTKKVSDDTVPPIEIIFKEKHKHEGNDEIFEYTEMELGNSKYHRHFHSLEDIEFASMENNDINKNENMIILDGHEKEDDIQNQFKHTTYKTKPKRVVTKSEEQSILPPSQPKATDINKKINEIAMICGEPKDLEQTDSKYYGKLFHNLLKAVYTSDEKFTDSEIEQKEKITHHYEKLNNWISYIV